MPKVRNYEMMDADNPSKMAMPCFMKEERQCMTLASHVYLIRGSLI